MTNPVRMIPSIKQLQDDERFQNILNEGTVAIKYITAKLQTSVERLRNNMLQNQSAFQNINQSEVVSLIFDYFSKDVQKLYEDSPRPVINATGTILHTNLGRARLSDRAVQLMTTIAQNYSNLEYDLAQGKRGSRYSHVEDLLGDITGAEAAMVVNNNAAAVFLILRAFAKHKEVIVSRGELVEIGGSFRISSIMEESDASLIEVGTTNKTHASDYEKALSEDTALILKVHQSNFGMYGFTSAVERSTLINIAKQNNLIFYEDLGSGAFFDLKRYGIGNEPLVSEIIDEGVDVVSCSGDKLLGGPQVGIILGKEKYINQLKKHQLARTLRIDKMTLAALHATLQEYLSNDGLIEHNPTIRDMLTPVKDISDRAKRVLKKIESLGNIHCQYQLVETEAQVGGGTLPGFRIPSFAIAIKHSKVSAHELAKRFRTHNEPVIPRVQEDWVLIDFRTVTENEAKRLEAILEEVLI